VLCRSLFNQLLQLTALVHFDQNIATADQLTVNPQLREGRPVCVFRQLGADVRVLQDINVESACTAWAEKPQLGSFGEPFM